MIDVASHQNVQYVYNIYFIEVRIQQRLACATDQQNVYSLDKRIYHRIWVAQTHLLPTLVKLMEKLIDNNIISVTNKEKQMVFCKIKLMILQIDFPLET